MLQSTLIYVNIHIHYQQPVECILESALQYSLCDCISVEIDCLIAIPLDLQTRLP